MPLSDKLVLDIKPYLQAIGRAEDRFGEFKKLAAKDGLAVADAMRAAAKDVSGLSQEQTAALRKISAEVKRVTREAAAEAKAIRERNALGLIDERQMERELGNVRGRVARFVREVSKDGGALNASLREDLVGALDAVGGKLEATTRVSRTTTGRMREGWEGFTGKLESMSTRMKAAVVGAMLAIGFSVQQALSKSFRSAATFDQAVTDSLAIMKGRTAELDAQLVSRAKELAVALAFDPSEVAAGYEYLALAGYEAAESLALIEKTAKFARAGNFDLAKATDLATDSLSALGLAVDDPVQNAENMERVLNALIAASTSANATTEQFAESLTNGAAAGLRSVNKELEEGLGLLAVFADRGIKGARASEQVQVILRDLPKAYALNKKGFEDLGLSIMDADGNLKHMSEVIRIFDRELGAMSDTQRAGTMAALQLGETVAGAMNKLKGGADDLLEYEAAVTGVNGAMDSLVDERMTAFNRRLDQVKIRVQNLVETRFGAPMLERLSKALDRATDLLENHEEAVVDVAKAIGGVVIAALTMQAAIYGVRAAVAITTTVIAAYRAGLLLLSAAKYAVTLNTRMASWAMAAFTASVAANPIGLLLTVLSAAAAAWLVFRDRVDESSAALGRLEQQHRRTMKEIWEGGGAQLAAMESAAEATEKSNALALTALQDQLALVKQQRAALKDDLNFLNAGDMVKRDLDLQQREADLTLAVANAQLRLNGAQEQQVAIGERLEQDANVRLAYLRAHEERLIGLAAAADPDPDSDAYANLQANLRGVTEEIRVVEAAIEKVKATADGDDNPFIPDLEISAASLEMLAEAETALQDLTQLQRQARELRQQAVLDAGNRAALLKKAGELEDKSDRLEEAKALEAVTKLRERLTAALEGGGAAYADELRQLRELKAEYPDLAEQIDAAVAAYESAQQAMTEAAEVDLAVRSAQARYAVTKTEGDLALLQRALAAQRAYWVERAAAAETGSKAEAEALERAKQATEQLKAAMGEAVDAAKATADAEAIVARYRDEHTASINKVNVALQQLNQAYAEADTEDEREEIMRWIFALEQLSFKLQQTKADAISMTEALSTGFREVLPQAITEFAMLAGDALAGFGDDVRTVGDAVLQIIAGVATQIGRLLIAMGTAELLNPFTVASGLAKIAAGSTLLGLATAVKSMNQRSVERREQRREAERERREEAATSAPPLRTTYTPGRGYVAGGYVLGPEQVIRVNENGAEYVVPAGPARRYRQALDAMRMDRPPAMVAHHVARATAGIAQSVVQPGAGAAATAAPGTGGGGPDLGAAIDRLSASMPSRLSARIDGRDLVVHLDRIRQENEALYGPR